jgi:hypothetical protein
MIKMGWGIRIIMIVIILAVLGVSLFYLLLASGDMNECVDGLTKSGKRSVEDAQDACKSFMKMKDHRLIVFGISGLIIVVCGIVFYVKGD